MARFTDRLKREWPIEFNCGLIKPLREVGFDLNKVLKNGETFEALEDLEKRIQVLWILCEEQAKALSIEPEDFASGFDGPAMFGALTAISEALVTFSQSPEVAAEMIKQLPGRQAKVNRMIIEQIRSGSNGTSGNSPVSLESAPSG
jgi:hypothetical protein